MRIEIAENTEKAKEKDKVWYFICALSWQLKAGFWFQFQLMTNNKNILIHPFYLWLLPTFTSFYFVRYMHSFLNFHQKLWVLLRNWECRDNYLKTELGQPASSTYCLIVHFWNMISYPLKLIGGKSQSGYAPFCKVLRMQILCTEVEMLPANTSYCS